MLRSYFHFSEKESLKEVHRKIKSRITRKSLSFKIEKVLNLFLGAEEEGNRSELFLEDYKRTLFQAIQDLLRALLNIRPLILAFDDMQWVDATTRDLLAFLLHSLSDAPLLVICAGRPHHEDWCPALPHTFIRLEPLPEKPARRLINAVLGTNRLDKDILEKIIDHSGGNPLFLIEMGESLKSQDLIACDSRKCTLPIKLEEVKIPETIGGLLMARLDSLPEFAKKIVQLASIIGHEFSYNLLTRLVDDTESLRKGLSILEKDGMIEPSSSDSGRRYAFRHQMMQEVAYRSMLKQNRRRYHRLVAEAMERLYTDNLSNFAEPLGHHYYHGHNWPKALAYTLETGHHAKRSFACREALTSFDRALDILKKGQWDYLGEQRLEILKWKGGMHFCLGEMEDSRSALQSMYSEAKQLNEDETEAEALFRLGWVSFYTHQHRASEHYLSKAVEMGHRHGYQEILLKATSFLGFLYSVLGKLKEAKPLLIQALDLSEDASSLEAKAWCLAYATQYYNWTGEFGEALAISEELLKLNEELKSPYFHILMHFRRGLIYGALGKLYEAKETLEAGLKQVEMGDNRFWRPRLLNTLGWIHSEGGNIEEALKLNKQALGEALPSRDPEIICNSEINIAENYIQLGKVTLAVDLLEKIWHRIKRKGIAYTMWRYKTRLFIALGEVHAKGGDRKKASTFLRKALNMARVTGSKRHEARALYVKAGLLTKNRPKTALQALKEAHALAEKMETKILIERINKAMKSMGAYGG
jgi:tetratricopeptide (TPR) repeat protein